MIISSVDHKCKTPEQIPNALAGMKITGRCETCGAGWLIEIESNGVWTCKRTGIPTMEWQETYKVALADTAAEVIIR